MKVSQVLGEDLSSLLRSTRTDGWRTVRRHTVTVPAAPPVHGRSPSPAPRRPALTSPRARPWSGEDQTSSPRGGGGRRGCKVQQGRGERCGHYITSSGGGGRGGPHSSLPAAGGGWWWSGSPHPPRQTAGRGEALHQHTAGLHPLPVDGDDGEAGPDQSEGGQVGVVRPVVHLPVRVGPTTVRTADTRRRRGRL